MTVKPQCYLLVNNMFVMCVEFPASGGKVMGGTAVARLEERGLSSGGMLGGVNRGVLTDRELSSTALVLHACKMIRLPHQIQQSHMLDHGK